MAKILQFALLIGLVLCAWAIPRQARAAVDLAEPGGDVVDTSPSGQIIGINLGVTPVTVSLINDQLGAAAFYSFGVGVTGSNASVANIEAGHVWGGHESLTVSGYSHHDDAHGSTNDDLYDFHATGVAFMIAGRVDSNLLSSQTGIAYDAQLYSGAIASSWNENASSTYATGFNTTTNSVLKPYQDYFGTVDVINSSWGAAPTSNVVTSGFGHTAVSLDALAYNNPTTTLVMSAGNSGADGDNTVGSPGSGYNGITVGALENDGSGNYDSVASFSGNSPQDFYNPTTQLVTLGVRAAVDIVAPGTHLIGAYYGGRTGGNNTTVVPDDANALANSWLAAVNNQPDPASPADDEYYGYDPDNSLVYSAGLLQGTSYSSPIVAGGATLLHDLATTYGVNNNSVIPESAHDSRVIKAVLLNSADKISGWSNGQSVDSNGVIVTTQSLDWDSGAGAMNLGRAFNQLLPLNGSFVSGNLDIDDSIHAAGSVPLIGATGWDLGSITEGTASSTTFNYYVFEEQLAAGSDLTVTLSWFRERALPTENTFDALNAADERQADLDLFIYEAGLTLDSDGNITGYTVQDLVAQSSSQYNTVEHLHFSVSQIGYYLISVGAFEDTFDINAAAGDVETYGLAWDVTFIPEPGTASALVLIIAGVLIRRNRPRLRPAV